jgi:hypothetical protein
MTSLVAPRATAAAADQPWHALPIGYPVAPAVDVAPDTWIYELPKKLESPNRVIWAHWRRLGRERKQWETLLWVAAVRARGHQSRAGLAAAGGRPRCDQPMRVAIQRYVASAREFIRDDDNLVFASKPLFDALKRVGLIHDDRRGWLRADITTQHVSPDGRPRTVVRLWPDQERQ